MVHVTRENDFAHELRLVNSLKLSQCFVKLNPQALSFFINSYDASRSQEADVHLLAGEIGREVESHQGLIIFLKRAPVPGPDKGSTLADVLGKTFERGTHPNLVKTYFE